LTPRSMTLDDLELL